MNKAVVTRGIVEGNGLGRSPSGRPSKQREVLDVAAEYFLNHGYEGASISAMARSSGISKESIYRYFSSKQELFEAVIDRELYDYRDALHELDGALAEVDLRGALLLVATTVLGVITTDRTLALRRLIFAEAARCPEMGQHYYEIGPRHAHAKLRSIFESELASAEFDSDSLSRYFIALISHRVMLARECGIDPAPSRAQIEATAERSVDDFCRAFLREPESAIDGNA